MPSAYNPLLDRKFKLKEHELETVIASLGHPTAHSYKWLFPLWDLDGQDPPPGDWRTWVIMAGRGFGKTRAGAEWVLDRTRGGGLGAVRIALVAATVEEARSIMIDGPSGILACAKLYDIADWSPARHTLTFQSGAQAFLYSGASPESLRGPEHDFAWCDELAKWRHPKATWDNLQLGLRRGARPQSVVTTTPKAGTVLNAILEAKMTVRTGGGTRTNTYLPEAYIDAVEALYAGTRQGAEELEGVLLHDVEGSLWPAALIERSRLPLPMATPEFSRIVVGVDPPASVGGTCGIVVCGLALDGRAHVLADASVSGRSPEGWARAVVDAAELWEVDRVVAERNQGGDMVSSVLRAANATLPIRTVHASRGKSARAEPVAALFESERAVFAGRFPELEAELSGLQIGGGYAPGYWAGPGGPGASPDRADAMVWALWALMLEAPAAIPQVRAL